MPAIQLTGYGGENRAVQPKLLDKAVGVLSRNQKPGRGDFRPWRTAKTVATVPAGRKTIYRMGRDVASDTDYWLSWTTRVHAVRGFNTEDTTELTYFTGDGAPKVTNNILALASAPYPTASRPLGVPTPATAPTVVQAAEGTANASNADYYYVYTYVTDWGWESAPSPVSALHVRKTDATSTVSGFAAPPAGNYAIDKIRVYRTQAGTGGGADVFFLREIALGTTSTTDDNRQLNDALTTQKTSQPGSAWLPAPDDLKHLTALWNGMLAGISGNGVRFCEPYSAYAWPINYEILPPDAKPVALGTFGQTLLVLTDGRPLVVAGSSPEAMDQMPLEMYQGCVSADSVVSMGSGVAWASEDGLCWYGAGGPRVLTAGLMLREDWQALKPSTIAGKMYEGVYFGSYDDGAGRKGFLIDPSNPTGIYFLDTGYTALHFDELQDQLYVLDGVNVKRWDAGDTFMTAKYRSKEFYHPRPMNYACAEVVADAYPVTFRLDVVNLKSTDAAKILAAVPLLTGPTPTSVRFTWQVASREPFRLPGGFMGTDWQVEIESTVPVQLVNVATSVGELANL